MLKWAIMNILERNEKNWKINEKKVVKKNQMGISVLKYIIINLIKETFSG